jgi:hypothetical protein
MRALGAELDVFPAVETKARVTAEGIRRTTVRAAELASPGRYATDLLTGPPHA